MPPNLQLQDESAEAALVGAALIDNNIFGVEIPPDAFVDPTLRAVWRAGRELHTNGIPVDPVTMPRDVISPAGLWRLIEACPTHVNWQAYADIVLNLHEQRCMLDVATAIGKAAYISDPARRAAALDAARAKIAPTTPQKKEQFSIYTADEILLTEWPEPAWVIPGLLTVGLCILAGKAKLGKSWLALQIAQAVSTGGRVFGKSVEHGKVLYLALEDPQARLKDRMKKQGWGLGAQTEFMPVGRFTQEIGDLRNGGGEKLSRLIKARGYKLVTIDTLSRAIYGDQNDNEAMTRALEPIQEMAHNTNCCVMMVDHHGKAAGLQTDMVSDILGSTAKGAMADCIWSIYRERGKAGAKLAVTGREIAEQEIKLVMDFETGCWQVDSDDGITTRRREILDALEKLGEATLKQISDVISQPKSNTHTRLQDLCSAGLVQRFTTDDEEIKYRRL